VTLVEHRLRIGDRAVTLLEGPAGWGEISPLPGYPCDPERARLAAEEAACVGWPLARRPAIPVNALVADAVDPDALAGFGTVKVKVGRDRPSADIDRLAAVRDAVGPHVRVRVDANGAWDVATAVDRIARLARFDLELVEQPVATLDDLARVRRRVAVPVAADESVRSLVDARRARRLHAADVLVLKVQPLGGVAAALAVADAAGIPALVTSMMETSIGLAAGAALAAALPDLPYACGLATAGVVGGDVVRDPLVAHDGMLAVRQPVPDPALMARYGVSR